MKSCTCYALRAVDCTCKPAKYGELYTSPTAKQEPMAIQMDVIVVNLVREGINKHRARELAEHFIKHTTPPKQEAKDEPVAGQPLPCPFCGHVGLDFADGETYRWGVASCGRCGASCGDIRREYPDLGEWHTEAIAEWNRRSPAPQRKPLTDEQIGDEFVRFQVGGMFTPFLYAVRAIEAAHGIKGEA